MLPEGPRGELTGYVCPHCGGALWRLGEDGSPEYARIGHAFSPEQLWIDHCAERNAALTTAARALAENAELGHELAELARALGQTALATRLDQEARSEERYSSQIREMLEGLVEGDAVTDAGG